MDWTRKSSILFLVWMILAIFTFLYILNQSLNLSLNISQNQSLLMYQNIKLKHILNPHSTIPIRMDITIWKNNMEDIKRLMYNILEMKEDTKMIGKLKLLSLVM